MNLFKKKAAKHTQNSQNQQTIHDNKAKTAKNSRQ